MSRIKRRQIGDPRRNYAREWKRWRKAEKLTRDQLASILGMGIRTIQRIEGGYNRPRVSTRMKFKALQERYAQEKAWQQQSAHHSL